MQGTGVHAAQEILLLLLVFVAAFGTLARRLQTPYPIVLVIAGLLLGFVPGIPRIALDPDLIFLVVLPPLVYSAAWVTSWRDFSYNLVSIVMLAVGLVGFTVLGIAEACHWLLPGFDWQLGYVLGAVVATTDAIAATSIARRIGLPKSIVGLLEGESLMNDATGLLALEFAVGMVVSGQNPTLASGSLRFAWLIVAGIGSGLILGRVVFWFERRIDDGPIEIAISLLVPYAAYLAAEAIHGSGVFAVMAAGLYLGRRSSEFFSPRVRVQAEAVWDALTFIINGVVFVLIGLQLPAVLEGVSKIGPNKLLLYGGVFSAFLIVFRVVWTFPGAYAAHFIRRRLLGQRLKPFPNPREVFVIGWTGMRGVIALAAAMSLPQTLADGKPFPHRDLIVFLTFCVILTTLVAQGLCLPWLIRVLGLAGANQAPCGEQEGRRLVVQEAMRHLEEMRPDEADGLAETYDDLMRHYQHRLTSIAADRQDLKDADDHHIQYLDLSRSLLNVERRAALRLRDEGRITDDVLREMEHELDLDEIRLEVALSRRSR
jgi:monovalent cation/hydrogen antiporter